MERTLAQLAASDAPLDERLAVVGALARAVAALHARGRAHGALRPDAVTVLPGGGVALGVAADAPPGAGRDAAPGAGRLAGAGFEAPEVARGGRATRRSDAFSVGALAFLALAGRAPFEADEPLERVRRVLFVEPPPLRRLAPGVDLVVEGVIAALLEKRARRRAGLGELLGVLEAPSREVRASLGTGRAPGHVARTALRAVERAARTTLGRVEARYPGVAAAARRAGGRVAGTPAVAALSPVRRGVLAVVPILALALLALPADPVARLEEDVAALVERGELDEARRRLERAAEERPGHPRVEKLRGDVACARGAGGECLRRYRVALAARPALRDDPALRENARRLLGGQHGCGTRRAAAHLLGELRDPEALPALEAARRSAGLLAFLCTGDAIDRAISATRAAAAR